MARVMIVEDEKALNDLLRAHLEQAGHTVEQAYDGLEAVRKAESFSPDLVVLDWMLPQLDGLSVCRELRRRSLVPILMLTARHEEGDRVTGLEVGADDYLVKPFSIAELVARIRAMLRRVALDRAATDPAGQSGLVVSGPLVLDVTAFTATLGGERVPLTRREFEVLALLVGNPGRTFTRDFLLDRSWGADYEGLDRAVDTQMARLRRKLGSFGHQIEAVWGLGYRFRQASGDRPT
ncbi:MAG: response regulator transcription factor [Candidatus Dormibacteraeota bacterium]|nr:response regulator transcription factor [Candidatus Dormibacteraeota bacterium]